MMTEEKVMNLWSVCKFCEKWVPDPEGNTYRDDDLELHATEIVCDDCRATEKEFKMIREFATEGIVYKTYGESFIQRCIDDVLKKLAPKSDFRYTYLEIDFRRFGDVEDMFSFGDNNPNWYAYSRNKVVC